jgi:hypothetical protein
MKNTVRGRGEVYDAEGRGVAAFIAVSTKAPNLTYTQAVAGLQRSTKIKDGTADLIHLDKTSDGFDVHLILANRKQVVGRDGVRLVAKAFSIPLDDASYRLFHPALCGNGRNGEGSPRLGVSRRSRRGEGSIHR